MSAELIDEQLTRVADAAAEARSGAYAPYSNFLMGAAILGTDGETIITGVLVENVSLGLAMCAERVALFTAVTNQVKPKVLAVCSRRTGDELTLPCGACLQVALELAGPDLIIVARDPDGVQADFTLGDLLTRGPKRHTPEFGS